MKRNIALITGCLLLPICLLAQSGTDTISRRIVLIGDAGQLTNGSHPVVNAVRSLIPLDDKTTVLYLGDNLYKSGLPDNQYSTYLEAKKILDVQLSIAKGRKAKVLMIPGNHDWDNGRAGGYDAILRQQLYIDFLDTAITRNAEFWPKDGCPGPKEINLGTNVTLILFDSQWWLHPYDKPEIESDCDCKTKEELVTQIEDIAAKNSGKLIIVACHHPFKSNGIHGGFFTLKQHLFPLTDLRKTLYIPMPVIGSIYPIARSVFGTPQDLKHPVYQDMIQRISEVVKAASPNVVFVSGHDHNLQHIREGNYNYIVSGGGCKQSRTSKSGNSLFNSTSEGFAVIEVSKNNNVTLDFYTVSDSATAKKEYTGPLLNIVANLKNTTDTASTVTVDDPMAKYKDSITVPASDDFPRVKGLKRFFMGQNYRPEWSAPVKMQVFNIRKEGMKVLSVGGGKQTKSLRLVDTSGKDKGKEWVLRSMNKSPTRAIPEAFRGTVITNIASEMISASHPYASLVVPELATPLGLSVARPKLVFIPDDPALRPYQDRFANNVAFLEERHVAPDGTTTLSSAKVFNEMLEDNDHRPVQSQVLRARLLDIILADFDRHFDQWRWVKDTRGKGVKYYPVPRDRDQALFYSDGFLLRLLSGRALPFLKGLQDDIPKVNWLGYSARDFDRIFLTDQGRRDWQKEIAFVQQRLTDSVIRKAVQEMPPEVFPFHGESIIQKLISRRNLLDKEAMRYYRFISRRVNIVGSNQKEYFKISNYGEGLQVRVYEKGKNSDTSFVMYDRIFQPQTTKEIRLYGLNDEDVFEIEENVKSRIKIRIIGGKGNDTFNIRGQVENLLYDLKVEGNYIQNKSHTKNRFSNEPPVNDRNILGFNYNTTKFPRLIGGYNADDGWMMGLGMSKRTYGFRNLPYATDQQFSALYSFSRKAIQFNYRGEFNHISRKTDLVIRGNYSSPSLWNFFGLGNSSGRGEENSFRFYQTRFRTLEVTTLLRRRFFEKLHFYAGPYFYSYNNRYSANDNNILSKFDQLGLDSARIFSKKAYLGGRLSLVLDNRNNEFLPTRGMHWKTDFTMAGGVKNGSRNYTAYTSDMILYASLTDPAKLIAILKLGGGKVMSDNYEFFQAMNFGANTNLMGFRKNRFAGKSMLYSGLELRFKLFDVNSFILPGSMGLTGFLDAGRIWHPNDRSKKWHKAFGGGLYYVPFNLFIISATAGFHEGERMFNFTLGTRFNLTY